MGPKWWVYMCVCVWRERLSLYLSPLQINEGYMWTFLYNSVVFNTITEWSTSHHAHMYSFSPFDGGPCYKPWGYRHNGQLFYLETMLIVKYFICFIHSLRLLCRVRCQVYEHLQEEFQGWSVLVEEQMRFVFKQQLYISIFPTGAAVCCPIVASIWNVRVLERFEANMF